MFESDRPSAGTDPVKFGPRARDRSGRFVPPEDNIRASDDHGISVTQTFRTTPTMARQISVLATESVATGKYPFKTKGDVMRCALAEGLSRLEVAEDEERPYLPVHQIDADMRAAQEIRKDMDRVCEQLLREVGALMETGKEGWGDAQVMLQSNIERILTLPDSPWRNRTLIKLKDKFPELLEEYNTATWLRFPAKTRDDFLPPDPHDREPEDDDPGYESAPTRRKTKKKSNKKSRRA